MDWSSDVCASDLVEGEAQLGTARADRLAVVARLLFAHAVLGSQVFDRILALRRQRRVELERLEMQFHAGVFADAGDRLFQRLQADRAPRAGPRSEEHTSELQSLMRISYAVFSL